MGDRRIKMVGKKFGRWKVIRLVKNHRVGKAIMWLCRCDCGTVRAVIGAQLRFGSTKSCGCLQSELVAKRGWKHGGSGTRLERVYTAMKQRCSNENASCYRNYGGRGITVCEEWKKSYAAFRDWALANGYREGLSIERKDNNGNYCPENCIWATRAQQNRNRRGNHYIEYLGERLIATDWAIRYGLSEGGVITKRLKMGWSVEEAITTPSKTIDKTP